MSESGQMFEDMYILYDFLIRDEQVSRHEQTVKQCFVHCVLPGYSSFYYFFLNKRHLLSEN